MPKIKCTSVKYKGSGIIQLNIDYYMNIDTLDLYKDKKSDVCLVGLYSTRNSYALIYIYIQYGNHKNTINLDIFRFAHSPTHGLFYHNYILVP